jgi:hypothetical protein
VPAAVALGSGHDVDERNKIALEVSLMPWFVFAMCGSTDEEHFLRTR